ncbi:uncharacterized protein N7484_001172 [Penicillium longicatenatum]|uniref:uncharacterized protein n=1 Tax=Penicillium longicatenatum TaxID=1561947 RepID=UPI002546A6B4|nr:uncharacterized protein N7484_001172 [Penicillium longicatenatum]KAJ5657523.1 hypothetical protein N7484_001172 [Penicillium longicatenatum]
MATSVRLSPQVQRLQTSSPYVDIYTRALPNPLRSRPIVNPLAPTTHSHPEPRRWQNPGGWGARHMNDRAPFTLWDTQNRKFRLPTQEESAWIRNELGDGRRGASGWFMWIETTNPPQPIPLTVGCMPVYFVGPGESHFETLPRAPYPNPRVLDPYPAALRWPKMQFPTKEQRIAMLVALAPLADVQAILYLPNWTIVELTHGDGRNYEPMSLPGVVAGRTTLYHHEPEPFYMAMKDKSRVRVVDPQQHMDASRPLPQDDANYLRDSFLTPGCRLECGFGDPGSANEFANVATTSGVRIVNSHGEYALTVVNHGFLLSNEVYHPRATANKIGEVFDTRPELDISLVSLTPAATKSYKNSSYFQAEPPRVLLEGNQIEQGTWSELDGMSSGLVTVMAYGIMDMKPTRPPGHPPIEFRNWRSYTVSSIFGGINSAISEGICGAPIVNCDTGGVGGFFHLFDETNCLTAHLDDLVAEGWQIV